MTTPPIPEPAPGFVRVVHDQVDVPADIPEGALALHEARGWRLADTVNITDEATPVSSPPTEDDQ